MPKIHLHRVHDVPQADGSSVVTTTVPKFLWNLCVKLAERWGSTPISAFRQMMDRIDLNAQAGRFEFFGPELNAVLRQIEHREEQKASEEIDYNKLHKSTKGKSGYVGVYANGKGFRAMGLDPQTNTIITLGTFDRADVAAWQRYLHYKANGLPYGLYAEALEIYEKDLARGQSREWQRYLAVKHMYLQGDPPDTIPEKYLVFYNNSTSDAPYPDEPEELSPEQAAKEEAIIAKVRDPDPVAMPLDFDAWMAERKAKR